MIHIDNIDVIWSAWTSVAIINIIEVQTVIILIWLQTFLIKTILLLIDTWVHSIPSQLLYNIFKINDIFGMQDQIKKFTFSE